MKLCTECFAGCSEELKNCPSCQNDDFYESMEEFENIVTDLVNHGDQLTAAGLLTKHKKMTIKEAADFCNLNIDKGYFSPLKEIFLYLLKENKKASMTRLVRELNHDKYGWDLIVSKEFVDCLFDVNK